MLRFIGGLSVFLLLRTCCSSLMHDADILSSLKQGFEHSDRVLSNWNISKPSAVCSWFGIRCFRGRVVAIDLTDLSLSGYVSSESLSSLDSLVSLSLAGNNFSGTIQISNLTTLRVLNISNNLFNGILDWDFESLPNLEVLDGYNNNFTGDLPLGVTKLGMIKYLCLGGNYFYGEIPSGYGNLIWLEFLDLSGNDLHGRIPGELGNLTKLKQLYLGYSNIFDGGIPVEFGKLMNLRHLDLASCGLDGRIPRQLGNLKLLDTLYLHTNMLVGEIPSELGKLKSMLYFDLSNNVLTGEIPFELVNLRELRLFNLFLNKLHGSIPDYIAELSDLETLGLWRNNFTGTVPEKLGYKGKLQILDLSSNKLTGMIPTQLCSQNKLETLILMNNFLFGPIPEGLGRCTSLTRVRLGDNFLNGSVPDGFLYLPKLNLAELQGNLLTGPFSENRRASLGSLPAKLETIDLSNNRLSGSLPISISNFSSLQILQLCGNQFSGPIPSLIGVLNQLIKLDLSRNMFANEIPSQIGTCSHLTYIDLSENNFTGPIPPSLSNIHILNYLNLSRNRLSETIPKSLGSVKSLTVADFSFNNLSGQLPETGQLSYFNASSFAGNPNLCGSSINNPCNSILSNHRKFPRNFKLILALCLLICSLVFAVAAIIKTKSIRNKSVQKPWKMTTFQKVGFSVAEVVECIKDCNVIGRGGAGIVYVGKLLDGDEIAVKKLLGFGHCSHDHGFKAEIRTLGNIRHRNIVRLIAFCSNNETNLLVYEFMRNGSLGEALYGSKQILEWNLRYKIAIEAAKGLCYLHHDCSPMIIHRDVKSNNILLDSNFEAHVADFGLAKFIMDGGASECMSAIAGSYGYIAPEYAYTLKVDEKSDVYSYGVVLLELITGRRPVGGFGDGVDIVQWAKRATNCIKESVTQIIDPRLLSTPKQAMHLFFVAILCVNESSVERPTMREVVQMLSEYKNDA